MAAEQNTRTQPNAEYTEQAIEIPGGRELAESSRGLDNATTGTQDDILRTKAAREQSRYSSGRNSNAQRAYATQQIEESGRTPQTTSSLGGFGPIRDTQRVAQRGGLRAFGNSGARGSASFINQGTRNQGANSQGAQERREASRRIQQQIRQNDPRNNRAAVSLDWIRGNGDQQLILRRMLTENPELHVYFFDKNDRLSGTPRYVGENNSNGMGGRRQMEIAERLYNSPGMVKNRGEYLDEAFGQNNQGIQEHPYLGLDPRRTMGYEFSSMYVRMMLAQGIIQESDMMSSQPNHKEGRFYFAGERSTTESARIKAENTKLQIVLDQLREQDPQIDNKITRIQDYLPRGETVYKGNKSIGQREFRARRLTPLSSPQERNQYETAKESWWDHRNEIKTEVSKQEREAKQQAAIDRMVAMYKADPDSTPQHVVKRIVRMQMSGDLPLNILDNPNREYQHIPMNQSHTPMDVARYMAVREAVEQKGINSVFVTEQLPFLEQYAHSHSTEHGGRLAQVEFENKHTTVLEDTYRNGLILLAERYIEAGQMRQLDDLERAAERNVLALKMTKREIHTFFDAERDRLKGKGSYALAQDAEKEFEQTQLENALKQGRMYLMRQKIDPEGAAFDRHVALLNDSVKKGRMKPEHRDAVVALQPNVPTIEQIASTKDSPIQPVEAEVEVVTAEKAQEISKEKYAEARRIGTTTRYLLDMYAKGVLDEEMVKDKLSELHEDVMQDEEIRNYLYEKLYSRDSKSGEFRYSMDQGTRHGLARFLENGDTTIALAVVDRKPRPSRPTLADVKKDLRRMNVITKNLGNSDTDYVLMRLSESVAEQIARLSEADKTKLFSQLNRDKIHNKTFELEIYKRAPGYNNQNVA